MQDDFIEDDDGSGYIDNGVDDWDQRNSGSEEEDQDSETEQDYYDRTGKVKPKRKKGGVSKKKVSSKKDDYSGKPKMGVGRKREEMDAFERGRKGVVSRPSIDAYKKPQSKDKEQDFMAKLMGGLDETTSATSSSSKIPATPSSNSNRKRKPDYEIYGDGSFSNFRQTSYSNGNHLSSPSTGPSGSENPSSDGIGPDVHITGSDTPPWKATDENDDLDSDLRGGNKKKFRSDVGRLPKRIGSLGLGNDVFGNGIKKEDDAMDLDDSRLKLDSDDEDEDSFSIKAPGAFTGKQRLVNASSIRAPKPKPQTSISAPAPVTVQRVEESKPSINSKPTLVNPSWKKVDQGASLISTVEAVDSATPMPQRKGGRQARPSTNTAHADSSPVQTKINAMEKDGNLRFFWYDHVEQDGKLILFGKVKEKDSGKFVSASVVVDGIERCLFLLPRPGKKSEFRAEGAERSTRTVRSAFILSDHLSFFLLFFYHFTPFSFSSQSTERRPIKLQLKRKSKKKSKRSWREPRLGVDLRNGLKGSTLSNYQEFQLKLNT